MSDGVSGSFRTCHSRWTRSPAACSSPPSAAARSVVRSQAIARSGEGNGRSHGRQSVLAQVRRNPQLKIADGPNYLGMRRQGEGGDAPARELHRSAGLLAVEVAEPLVSPAMYYGVDLLRCLSSVPKSASRRVRHPLPPILLWRTPANAPAESLIACSEARSAAGWKPAMLPCPVPPKPR